jgi:hypothetical protein
MVDGAWRQRRRMQRKKALLFEKRSKNFCELMCAAQQRER